jgi:uncharacterized protein
MYKRLIDLDIAKRQSLFLWGPRQTGKTTLLRQLWPDALYINLLLSTEFQRFTVNPSLLQEICRAVTDISVPVIIDEVQKVPQLLDEVHSLIESRQIRFILSGSSARKLKRSGANLLGGRAVRRELYPLTWKETNDFDLQRALTRGLLPRIYQSEDAQDLLRAYTADYLKEEVYAEALVRNLPSFSRFLENVALTNGEIVRYTNIASDVGVSAAAVKDYYSILVDTLLGFFVPAFVRKPKRRVIQAPKFYLFDTGVCGSLADRSVLSIKSEAFGRCFEHFVLMELRAHSRYSNLLYEINYWRTSSDFEVDFILNKGEVAVEVKSAGVIQSKHLKGLRAFSEEYPKTRKILVADEPRKRITDDKIEIYPWPAFLEELWNGKIVG